MYFGDSLHLRGSLLSKTALNILNLCKLSIALNTPRMNKYTTFTALLSKINHGCAMENFREPM